MAKKKKKAAKKKASGAEAQEFNEAELHSAAVVMWGAEGLLGAVEYLHFDINAVVDTFPLTVQEVSQREGGAARENGRQGWDYARRLLEHRDNGDLPRLRFVGRVLEVLLNHRGFATCSGGDVFMVFLIEIPDQLEVNHRQSPPPGQEVDVTEKSGRKMFTNRMKVLRQMELIRPTVTRGAGRKEDYVLTEYGQQMFDGWPLLTDIPGLELDGPVTPESRSRRRS